MSNPGATRRRLWRVGLIIAAVAVLAASSASVASASDEGNIVGAGSADAVPNSYIVVLKPAASSDVAGRAHNLAAQFNGTVDRVYAAALRGFATSMSAPQTRRLAAHPDVAYVQQNQTIRLNDTQPNPPSWGLDRIDQRNVPLDNSYTYPTLASSVHAYVIDTGIRLTHTGLGGRAVTGIDEVTPNGTADDCHGHGTHVAGTIGGTSYGVAKGVALVAVRVLDCSGSGTTAGVVAGVDWVTANAIKPAVANMSLGGSPDPTLDSAVANSIVSGVTYGVAAGNAGADACGQSPGRVSTAITVGATDINDNRALFSNFGSCVDIFAPGVSITSIWNTNDTATKTLSGTSMATPHVVGAAALILAANPTWTPDQVRSNMTGNATANKVVNPGTGSPNLLLYTGTEGVPPPPADDFAIAVSPSPGVTIPGGSVAATVSTTLTAGAAQPITLSASSLPAGVTATFNPTSVSTGGTSAATFNTSTGTPAGTYAIAINGTGTNATHAATYVLIVSSNKGTYYQLPPSRIMDTRTGNGAPKAPLGPVSTISLQVTGRGGVPATGVSAVVLNVTTTGATEASYLTVYPSGVARPTASSLNYVAGWTGANSVTVAVGTGGKVDIYNNAGSVEVIADVLGYYAADTSMVGQFGVGGQYQPVTPQRLFDSRTDWGFKLPSDNSVRVGVSYGPDVDPHIRALVVNVTAVDPSLAGYLTTWDGSGLPPGTSTLNYTSGATVPNMAVVPVSLCCGGYPSIGVYTHADTHVIVDILGIIDDSTLTGGLRFAPRTPVRIADTRTGLGAPNALGWGSTATITAPAAVAAPETQALALNVTAVTPTVSTYLSVWPNGIPGIDQPYVSNLNPAAGQTVPNAVYSLIGPNKAFNVYNNAGTTHLVVDVVGTFYDPTMMAGAASATPAPLSGKQQLRLTGTQPKAIRIG